MFTYVYASCRKYIIIIIIGFIQPWSWHCINPIIYYYYIFRAWSINVHLPVVANLLVLSPYFGHLTWKYPFTIIFRYLFSIALCFLRHSSKAAWEFTWYFVYAFYAGHMSTVQYLRCLCQILWWMSCVWFYGLYSKLSRLTRPI